MKYGFEKEYFVVDQYNNYMLCPKELPGDECGYLAEARGSQYNDPRMAAFAMLAEESRIKDVAYGLGLLELRDSPSTTKVGPALRKAALRLHGKNPHPHTRFNMYGKDFGCNDKWDRAGLHVHFSNEIEVRFDGCTNCRESSRTVAGMLNMPEIIRVLDSVFAKEIKEARRIPGFYELKPYGFEYRSLPANVDVVEVARVLERKGWVWY